MNNWFLHEHTLYNLDKFTQICFGDDNEVLLSKVSHNMDWIDKEEEICVLKFPDQTQRDRAFLNISKKLLQMDI